MTRPDEAVTFVHGPDWGNRLALAPLTNKQSHPDGTLSDEEIAWLVARGRGGFGAVMTAAAYVAPAGQAWDGQLGVASDTHLPGLTRLAAEIHATGASALVQLHHGGRRAEPRLTGTNRQCPWDDPGTGAVAMSTAEIATMVDDFVAAAVRAERAGFDGVQVHGAHGYLLGQFLDTRRNHRTDEYGGSFENRLRPVRHVVESIRDEVGADFHVGLRLSPEGYGIPLSDGRPYAAEMLATGLLDHLDISLWDVFMAPRGGEPGRLIDYFVDLPRQGARLGVTGSLRSTADVRWCLDRGADFVCIGTGAIVHHDFASRVLSDDGFTSRELPVPADLLTAEMVSPPFLHYLRTEFDGVVE